MKNRDKKLLVGGVILAIIIALLAPFLASPNPDGLEKSAEQLQVPETEPVFEAPLPDYQIEGLGKIGEILALVIGTIVVLVIAYGLTAALKSGKSGGQ